MESHFSLTISTALGTLSDESSDLRSNLQIVSIQKIHLTPFPSESQLTRWTISCRTSSLLIHDSFD